MHTIRIAADKSYQAALKACRLAESGACESVYLATHEALKAARELAVKMELAHPTDKEYKARSAKLAHMNRGLD